jgi:hypothetical protein
LLGVQEVASSSLVTPTILEHGRRCLFRIGGCIHFSAIAIFLAIGTCIILNMSYPKKSKHRLTEVMIYTDGACSGNPGPGGWAAIIMAQGVEKELSGVVDTSVIDSSVVGSSVVVVVWAVVVVVVFVVVVVVGGGNCFHKAKSSRS